MRLMSAKEIQNAVWQRDWHEMSTMEGVCEMECFQSAMNDRGEGGRRRHLASEVER